MVTSSVKWGPSVTQVPLKYKMISPIGKLLGVPSNLKGVGEPRVIKVEKVPQTFQSSHLR